jgi:hypothetical protein
MLGGSLASSSAAALAAFAAAEVAHRQLDQRHVVRNLPVGRVGREVADEGGEGAVEDDLADDGGGFRHDFSGK